MITKNSLPAIVILALVHNAAAHELTLGFNTLPSAQPWTYSVKYGVAG
jgi:hypothetical protein